MIDFYESPTDINDGDDCNCGKGSDCCQKKGKKCNDNNQGEGFCGGADIKVGFPPHQGKNN